MMSFWDTPAAQWLPTLVIHIRSQVKTRQNFWILQETLHSAHLLKLLDKMYKYEMDPTRMDGQMDRVKPVYPPNNFVDKTQVSSQHNLLVCIQRNIHRVHTLFCCSLVLVGFTLILSDYLTHMSTLTHWGQVMHICVSKLTTIGPDNGLAPSRWQAVIWTNTAILSIQTLGKKLEWNLKWNSCISIQENASDNGGNFVSGSMC